MSYKHFHLHLALCWPSTKLNLCSQTNDPVTRLGEHLKEVTYNPSQLWRLVPFYHYNQVASRETNLNSDISTVFYSWHYLRSLNWFIFPHTKPINLLKSVKKDSNHCGIMALYTIYLLINLIYYYTEFHISLACFKINIWIFSYTGWTIVHLY